MCNVIDLVHSILQYAYLILWYINFCGMSEINPQCLAYLCSGSDKSLLQRVFALYCYVIVGLQYHK